MMSAYANSVQKAESFNKYVKKFRSLCSMHGVQVGSRSELPDFMRKLMEDRHLAMDFWAFIGKLSDREGGELSDDEVLNVVVEGITDTEISQVDGGQKRTVDDLRAMLAGVDIHATEQSSVEMAPFPRSEAGSDQGDQSLWTESSGAHSPFTHGQVDGDADRSLILPATPPPQLDEALLRLELARLVQQYFDNIDKRISKLEPHPDGESSIGKIAPAITPRSLEEPASEDEMEQLRLRRTGRSRLVLEPIVPIPLEDSLTDEHHPIRVPLDHYSPPARFGRAPALLILVLIGAGFAIYKDPALLQHGFAAVVRQFQSDRAVPHPAVPPAPESTASQHEAPSSTGLSLPLALQPAVQGTSTPPVPVVDTPTPSVSVPAASVPTVPFPSVSLESRPSANHVDSNSRHVADRALAQTRREIEGGISSVEAAGAIRVNPSVMDRNLLVSRVPAYPESAKESGVEGDVIMQALISKDGTVKRVHVTEGDSRLRGAAEEAVYKWRYRPYVLNGQPVEVATTITVNFDLNR